GLYEGTYTTCGLACSMTITCWLSSVLVCTTCCSVDLSVPFASAFRRMRCTALITPACWARKALPRSVVHWMSLVSHLTTSGSPAIAWTLGSHGCFSTASASALPWRPEFFVSHC